LKRCMKSANLFCAFTIIRLIETITPPKGYS
jgi:hypothetical protein